MKVNITLTEMTLEEAQETLLKIGAVASKIFVAEETEEAEEVKPKTKKAKAKPAPVLEQDEDQEASEEANEETEEETVYVTVEDVRTAFKKAVTKQSDVKKARMAAAKILKKFGATTIDDLDKSDFEEAISLVKKLKI